MDDQGRPTDASPSGGQLPPLEIGRLVTDHHAAVYRYAYRLAGCQQDAEDLTQQVFLVAQQKLDQVRQRDKVAKWLFAILRSCWLKSCRKHVPLTAASLELDIDGIAEDSPQQPGLVDGQQLQEALDQLPVEFKLVVVMFYFEQSSYKEIAAQLEIPIGTVMSRLARAKRQLRQWLVAEPQEGPSDNPRKTKPWTSSTSAT